MEADTFQIAQNEQRIEYYAYIRQIMECKEVHYWIGNPSVQIINGTIYLKPAPCLPNKKMDNYEQYLKQYRKVWLENIQEGQEVSRTLLLAGIPTSKNPIEVCERLTAYLQWILEIRVIKSNQFKYYGMLLLIKDDLKSAKLVQQIFGDEYNGLEMERLVLREMMQLTYNHTSASKSDGEQFYQSRKRSLMGNQQILQKYNSTVIFIKSGLESDSRNININLGSSPKKRQNFIKLDKNCSSLIIEQSICAICQEETQGTVISILCAHYFHQTCLSQWKENICPLCRYHQHPPSIKFCQKCNQCEGLWVCLVCGVRLCGGADQDILGNGSHIYQHFLQSDHRLSMDVDTKFIFDASQAAFLHQMFYKQILKHNDGIDQNENNGKKGKKSKFREKISQHEQSISQQMQRQRNYFEEDISRQSKKWKQIIKEQKKVIEQIEAEIENIDDESAELDKKREQSELGCAAITKQLKVIADVQKYWKDIIAKKEKKNVDKSQLDKEELRILEIRIAEKKEELKQFKRNQEFSNKLKANLGDGNISSFGILQFSGKQSKKKKK